MRITNSPVDAFMGSAPLVTGVEPIPRVDGEGVRVYIGPRSDRLHVHMPDPDQADAVVQAWTGTLGALFATEIEPDALCMCDATDPHGPTS